MGRRPELLYARGRIDPRPHTKGERYKRKKKESQATTSKQAPGSDATAAAAASTAPDEKRQSSTMTNNQVETEDGLSEDDVIAKEEARKTHQAILKTVDTMDKNMATIGAGIESEARPPDAADAARMAKKAAKAKRKEEQRKVQEQRKKKKQADPTAVEVYEEGGDGQDLAPSATAEGAEGPERIGPSALRSTQQLYALPTREELESLREAESLFKSGLFRLQMDELLKHVEAAKVPQHVQECVNSIADALTCFERMKQIKVRDGKVGGKYAVPFQPPLHPEDEKDSVLDLKLKGGEDSRQCEVEYVGSVKRSLHAQPTLDVDISIQMPRGLLQHQDRKRFRYLYKRAAFLAFVASRLQGMDWVHSMQYEQFQGDELKPVLCVTVVKKTKKRVPRHRPLPGQRKQAKGRDGSGGDDDDGEGPGEDEDAPADAQPSRFRIVIHAVAPENFFKLQQLAPDHNTLQWPDIDLLYKDTDLNLHATGQKTATPRYTLRILHDVLMHHHAKFIASFTRDFGRNFKEAVLLLKTWLRQRNMGSRTFGTMNGFVATMLLIHLIQQREVPREASAYQMLLKVFTVIASSKWHEEPLAMDRRIDMGVNPPTTDELQAAFLVTFIGPSGLCNLLGHMSIGQYDELRFEAARAIKLLRSDDTNAFSSLFLAKVDPIHKFDTMLHARITPLVARKYPAQLLDRAGDWVNLAARLLSVLLRTGLGDRAPVVVALSAPTEPWPITQQPASLFSQTERVLTIGFLLNLETCYRTVDIAPSMEKEVEEDFDSFWGGKVTVRTLPDGAVRHAAVWDCSSHQRHLIVKWIALHVLAYHADLGADSIAMQPFFFEPLLAGAGVPDEEVTAAATGAADGGEHDGPRATDDYGMVASRLVSDAFSDLVKMVRRLDLPLLVRDFRCVSSTFRLTDPFPPAATEETVASARTHKGLGVRPVNEWQPVMEAVLQFEGSARWPDDVAAMQQVKLAFLIRMARLLEKHANSSRGSADGVTTRLTRQFLDVHFRGFVFRIVIFVKNEVNLVQQQAARYRAAAQQAQGSEQREALAAAKQMASLAAMMRRDMLVLPRLAAWIRGFAVQFSSFGLTARLAKRWIHAHMFSSHVPDELVDMLVLSLYNHDQPYGAPGSADVGFLRFLRLICKHNWVHDPLFVDPDGSLEEATKATVRERFREERQNLPIMFVASSVDSDSMWTKDSPSKLVFQRLLRFAKSAEQAAADALRSVGAGLVGGTTVNARSVFATPLGAYDVLLHISPSAQLRRRHALAGSDTPGKGEGKAVKPKFKNLQLKARAHSAGRPGFDPVGELYTELQRCFNDSVMFWRDELGGDVICAAVKPQVKKPFAFKMTKTPATRPQGDDKIVFDVEAFAAQCMQMGCGILDKATIRSSSTATTTTSS